MDGAWNTSPWQVAQPAMFKAKGQASPPDLNPAPSPLATVFYAGHQGPKSAQHALSRRSNGKGVGEGGTSTPRWGAPTLHARTQRTKLSFPLHRQMTTSSEYSGLQTKRMFMVYRNLTARSETCCLDDLLHSESCSLLFAHFGIVSIQSTLSLALLASSTSSFCS